MSDHTAEKGAVAQLRSICVNRVASNLIDAALAQAWDEGVTAFAKAHAYESSDQVRAKNPYRVTPPGLKCDACNDTGLVRWMSEGDSNCYQEPDGDGMVPCPDCATPPKRSSS